METAYTLCAWVYARRTAINCAKNYLRTVNDNERGV